MTNNQTEFLMNMNPEVMCNVPGKDCVEKNQTRVKSILNLCMKSTLYISIIYIFKNIDVLEHSGFCRLAMFICLVIQYIKINMIFSILLVDTMSCM